MFSSQTNIGNDYQQMLQYIFESLKATSKIVTPGLEVAIDKTIKTFKEPRNPEKLSIEMGKDTYNLIPDELTLGAYKWEKVDLTNGSYSEKPNFSQSQEIATKLILNTPKSEVNNNLAEKENFKVTAYFEKNRMEESEIIYQENNKGECITNKITENLSLDKILEIGGTALSVLISPEVVREHNKKQQEFLIPENATDIIIKPYQSNREETKLDSLPIDISTKVSQSEYDSENLEIAKNITALLEKYGISELDGSRIYNSDAFVILESEGDISVHRQNDEFPKSKSPIIEFSLDEYKIPIINVISSEITSRDRSEFLINRENLPDITDASVWEIGKALGMLSPIGTAKAFAQDPSQKLPELPQKIVAVQPNISQMTKGVQEASSLLESSNSSQIEEQTLNVQNNQSTDVSDAILIADVKTQPKQPSIVKEIEQPDLTPFTQNLVEKSSNTELASNLLLNVTDSKPVVASINQIVSNNSDVPSLVAELPVEELIIPPSKTVVLSPVNQELKLDIVEEIEPSSASKNKTQMYPPTQTLFNETLDDEKAIETLLPTTLSKLEIPSQLFTQSRQPARQVQLSSKENTPNTVSSFLRNHTQRVKEENKQIAKNATALLEKYGTREADGTCIYRSDAFVIREEDGNLSIHRRNDEVSGFKLPLLTFALDKNKEPKSITASPELSPVERQEFLLVNNQNLPDLKNNDIRLIANSLGSLAPAGTISTLESFKQSKLLDLATNVLKKSGQEKVELGNFTIVKSIDEKNNNQAQLQVIKSSLEGGNEEIVCYNRVKDERGNASIKVTKMNISDYDINSIKFLAENTLNLSQDEINQTFHLPNTKELLQPTTATESQEKPLLKTAGDIVVKIHPYIEETYRELFNEIISQSKEDRSLATEMSKKYTEQNKELSIADQGTMYSQISDYNTDRESPNNLMSWSAIQKDLQKLRGEKIDNEYTPISTIKSQEKAQNYNVTKTSKNLVKQEVEM